MLITITNLDNNKSIQFLSSKEYTKRYNPYTVYQHYNNSYDENIIRLVNIQGIYTNPSNNNLFVKGLDEDGSDFYSNNYNNRIITIQFDNKYTDFRKLNQVLYMQNRLLYMSIETPYNTYSLNVSVDGSYENGVLTLIADNIFFNTNKTECQSFTLPDSAYYLLPLTLPQTLFGQTTINATINITAEVPSDCIIQLQGKFVNLRITNMTTGTVLDIICNVNSSLTIDTFYKTIMADGVSITSFTGLFPSLISNVNTLFFVFSSRTLVTTCSVCYDVKTLSVY